MQDYSMKSIHGHVKTQHPRNGVKVWKCGEDGKAKWANETMRCPTCNKVL